MTATRSAVLAKAAAEIGTIELPHGSNIVKYTSWFGMIGPWCDMFISWVAAACDATDIVGRFAYTPSHVNWFKARNQWFTSGPKVGDLVFFDFGLGRVSHVGFVERLFADGTMQTIEGNTDERGGRTGGRVMRKTRSQTQYVVGYGRPAYKVIPVAPTPPPVSTPTVMGWQHLLAFASERCDGDWGPVTDQRAAWMRSAAMGHLPSKRSTIRLIQRVIGTQDDGDFGAKSKAAMMAWVKRVQRFLGFTGRDVDGDWGPKTDKAYLAFRKRRVGRY